MSHGVAFHWYAIVIRTKLSIIINLHNANVTGSRMTKIETELRAHMPIHTLCSQQNTIHVSNTAHAATQYDVLALSDWMNRFESC